jgi:hypothetical protein
MLTRDSALWWIGICSALVLYLSNAPTMDAWTYAQWLQFAAFGLATLSAKLATSPLPGAPKTPPSDTITRAILPFLLAAGLLSCAKPPASLQTPEAQRAWQANEVVTRIGEVQRVAIQAEATGGLTTAQARVIVTYCVASAKVAKAYPKGWEQTVLAGFLQMKAQLPPAVWQSSPLTYTLAILEGMVTALAGGTP